MMAVLQAKAPNPQTMRKIVLEGHRFAPKEALVLGLVDHIAGGGTESLLGEKRAEGSLRRVCQVRCKKIVSKAPIGSSSGKMG